MLSIYTPSQKLHGKPSRRDVLRAGFLGFAGLSLPDLLRARAVGGSPDAGRNKSVIMIWLRGGPSHIDSYDMKPEAPVEIRGEFDPIATNVSGIDICEHMPLQSRIMDKLAIVRGIKSNDLGDHTPHYIFTGFADRGRRPVFGSIVSYLQPRRDGLPPYVSLMYQPPKLYDIEGPTYTGPAHRPFVPKAEGLANLSLAKGVSLDRLRNRRQLLEEFDALNRQVEHHGASQAIDAHTERAIEMIASTKMREALDLSKESPEARERYGKYSENLLLARRVVEAGVPVVTVKIGDWDTHEHNFRDMREQLPQLDQGFHALIMDLYERGLQNDVAVVMWGEFGRSPRIDHKRMAGRDHWPEAGAAVVAGGGFKVGQVIGETDPQAGRSNVRPYTPSNVLANLYRHLGIDPAITIPDFNNRPMHVLDDRELVRELL